MTSSCMCYSLCHNYLHTGKVELTRVAQRVFINGSGIFTSILIIFYIFIPAFTLTSFRNMYIDVNFPRATKLVLKSFI